MLNWTATRTEKIGLISKKTYLYISLPLFCTTTTRNFLVTGFMKELCSQKILLLLFLFTFFFTAAHFHLVGR